MAARGLAVSTFLLLSFIPALEGQTPGPLEPLAPGLFDRAAAAHLLSRAGFGGTAAEIDELHALGLEKAIERLLDEGRPDPAAADFQATSTERPSRRDLANLTEAERQAKIREHRRSDQEQFQGLRAWWVRRMVLTSRPLVEKMTLFWHGHFATSQREVRNAYHMYLQNRLFRSSALGNFRNLTRAVAKDPAMLEYLDNNQNNRRKPNENFARELLELFTVGIGNYSEMDVKEAARALTGWTFQGNEFVWNRRAHDDAEKTFLGRTGRLTGDDIIDIIFEQPAASRFIARKLFIFFAHDDPSPEVVEALAETLRGGGFEVRPVLARLYASAVFYSPRARANRVKAPVELAVGTLRLLGMDPGPSPAIAFVAGRMGQDLFLPPSVKGWDGGENWISTKTLFDRYNFARAVLGLEGAMDGRGKGKDRGLGPGPRGRMPRWDAEAGAGSILGPGAEKLGEDEVVERVIRHFLVAPVSDEARRKLVDFYSKADPKVRLRELIHLVLSSPEYQLG